MTSPVETAEATNSTSNESRIASSSELPTPIVDENVSHTPSGTATPEKLDVTFDMNVESAVSSFVEQSNEIVTLKEEKLSDDDAIDVQSDNVGEIGVKCGDDEATCTPADEGEKTNIFDETFEIEADSETNKQDEVKELLNTPKPIDRTNLVEMKELFDTPKAHERTNLVGMKKLLDTPKAHERTNLVGMKELLDTPKAHERTNLVGMKELLDTPKAHERTNLVGIKELLDTPKALDRTNLIGMKELLNTPNDCNKTVDMRGVRELLKTPSSFDEANLIGIADLVKTPPKQEEYNLEGVQESPESSSSTADAKKKFRFSFKFNSRDSLVHLLNSKMSVFGFAPLIPEVEPSAETVEPVENESHHVASGNSELVSTGGHSSNDEDLFASHSAEYVVSTPMSAPQAIETSSKVDVAEITEATETVKCEPSIAGESKVLKTPERQTRKRKATEAETEESHGENVTDNSEATETKPLKVASALKTQRQTSHDGSSESQPAKVASPPAKTPKRQTRKRKATETEPEVSHEVEVAESDEAREAVKSQLVKVANGWVLTAAHCTVGFSQHNLRFGTITSTIGGQLQTAFDSISHPGYNSVNMNNDISVIPIPWPLSFNAAIQPIRLPTNGQISSTFVDAAAVVSGWGSTVQGGGASQTLNWVDMRVISNAFCSDYFGDAVVADTVLGATGGGGPNQGHCGGDSGSPLTIVEGGVRTQIGVVSFGAASGCDLPYPSGYTRTANFVHWIYEKTGIAVRP